MSICLAIPTESEDIKKVDTFIQQTGKINSVKVGDGEAIKIRNSKNEEGDIITETELRKIEEDSMNEDEAISIEGDKVVIHDTHRHREPRVQVINEGEDFDLAEIVDLEVLELLR
jgi:hypothetical protein